MKKFLLVILVFISMNGFSQLWKNNLPEKPKNELTFFDFQHAFYSYWEPFNVKNGYYVENGEKKKAIGWKQFKRWEYEMYAVIDPVTGKFPLKTASQVKKDYFELHPKPKAGIAANWTSLGPNSSSGGYAGIGRVNCIAFHPTDVNVYWVGAAGGGLWKTEDNGNNWVCLTDQIGTTSVSDIIIPADYSTSHTIFIATGDRDHYLYYPSKGVLKSTDGGATWNQTGLQYAFSDLNMVNKLLIDPTNNNVLLAATQDGVFKTTDGGITWNTQLNFFEFIDMEYQPGNFSKIYGSTKQGQIYVSSDGGLNWTLNFDNQNAKRIELAVSPNQPNWVYAIAAGYGASESTLHAILKSVNAGGSFTQVFSGNTKNLLGYNSDGSDFDRGQGHYDLCIAASPSNANVVYIGGVNTWKSTNGGSSWSISNHWTGDGANMVHADKHNLRYRSNGDLFECNDGGVYQFNTASNSWQDKSNGLVISQLYRLGVSKLNANQTIIGLQDNGTKLSLNQNWYDVYGGDGMECLIDYSNSQIQYATYVNGDLNRTMDEWASVENITPYEFGEAVQGNWVTPYVVHPTNPNTLYAGYAEVWKTNNRGDSWSKISNFNLGGSKINNLAVATSNPQYIYAVFDSYVMKSSNGGNTWENITFNLPVSSSRILSVAIKDNDPTNVWVTMSGFGNTGKVFVKSGSSNTWTNISEGIPSLPVYSIVQNTQAGNETQLFVATHVGVFVKNGENPWVEFNTNLPDVKVYELEIYYATDPLNTVLRAATFGRGLWETKINQSSEIPPIANFNANSQVCINAEESLVDASTGGTTTSWSWSISPGIEGVDWQYAGNTDSNSESPVIQFLTVNTYTVQLTVSNQFGTDTETKIISVVNNVQPSVSITASPTTICSGKPVTFTSSVLNAGTNPTYQWLVNGVTQSSVSSSFTSSTLNDNDAVVCLLSSSALCITNENVASNVVTIEVLPTPAKPTITANGTILTSSAATGNQWYLNGVAIPGATNNTYHVLQNGNYTVRVTGENGCVSAASTAFSMTNLSIKEITDNTDRLAIFPNPSNGKFVVEYQPKSSGNGNVSIKNSLGQVVFEEEFKKGSSDKIIKQINLSSFGKGVYYITIVESDIQISEKLIVM